MSSVFALKEHEPLVEAHRRLSKEKLLAKTKKLINELKIIEQLNVYTNLYKLEPLKSSSGRGGSYSLITLNSKENTINVQSFPISKIELATETYMNLEKKHFNNIGMNVVLVNSGDIKKLEVSYPNYFMDTKILLRNLSLIAIDKYL